MNLRTYFRALTPAQQEKFAIKAGTTANYIRTHLLCDPPRKIPRQRLLEGFVAASKGELTRESLLSYFYGIAA